MIEDDPEVTEMLAHGFGNSIRTIIKERKRIKELEVENKRYREALQEISGINCYSHCLRKAPHIAYKALYPWRDDET